METVTINPDGTFTYAPTSGFEGTDTFEYEVCDDGSPVKCDTVLVTVEVFTERWGERFCMPQMMQAWVTKMAP